MILQNEIILTTPILGCRVSEGRPRVLVRHTNGEPGLIQEMWHDSMRRAASDLGIKYDQQALILPMYFSATKFEEYLRVYNKTHKERFESIPKGAVVKFELHLMEDKLDPSSYGKLLSLVGKYYGMSQWGNKFGYGRFEVQFIKRQRADVSLDFPIDI